MKMFTTTIFQTTNFVMSTLSKITFLTTIIITKILFIITCFVEIFLKKSLKWTFFDNNLFCFFDNNFFWGLFLERTFLTKMFTTTFFLTTSFYKNKFFDEHFFDEPFLTNRKLAQNWPGVNIGTLSTNRLSYILIFKKMIL